MYEARFYADYDKQLAAVKVFEDNAGEGNPCIVFDARNRNTDLGADFTNVALRLCDLEADQVDFLIKMLCGAVEPHGLFVVTDELGIIEDSEPA